MRSACRPVKGWRSSRNSYRRPSEPARNPLNPRPAELQPPDSPAIGGSVQCMFLVVVNQVGDDHIRQIAADVLPAEGIAPFPFNYFKLFREPGNPRRKTQEPPEIPRHEDPVRRIGFE